jgi:hypothetical protein
VSFSRLAAIAILSLVMPKIIGLYPANDLTLPPNMHPVDVSSSGRRREPGLFFSLGYFFSGGFFGSGVFDAGAFFGGASVFFSFFGSGDGAR